MNQPSQAPLGEIAPPHREAGSISIELAILLPAFVALTVLAIVLGRQMIAQNSVDLAAHDAARAASLERTAATAKAAAIDAARSTLLSQRTTCRTLHITVDTTQFSRPVGEPATVTATISCEVAFADVAMPGMPGSRTVRASFASPLDRYRSRS
jgi:Flp pilus assembly protein TadG